MVSWFWRLGVQNQGISRYAFSKVWKRCGGGSISASIRGWSVSCLLTTTATTRFPLLIGFMPTLLQFGFISIGSSNISFTNESTPTGPGVKNGAYHCNGHDSISHKGSYVACISPSPEDTAQLSHKILFFQWQLAAVKLFLLVILKIDSVVVCCLHL